MSQIAKDFGISESCLHRWLKLVNAGGRLGLSDLASSIMLSQSGPSKFLDRMELAGLVRRDPNPRRRPLRVRHHHPARPVNGQASPPRPPRLPAANIRRRTRDRDLADLTRVMSRISASIP